MGNKVKLSREAYEDVGSLYLQIIIENKPESLWDDDYDQEISIWESLGIAGEQEWENHFIIYEDNFDSLVVGIDKLRNKDVKWKLYGDETYTLQSSQGVLL